MGVDRLREPSVPGAPTQITPDQDRDFRQELQRVLDSSAFASSRRLSGFLSYISDAALNGRTELDQYELAERVLNRPGDFNPLDDASVRKLASQIRHKLEEYYQAEGTGDRVVISLPRRSYLPRFRYRNTLSPEHDIEIEDDEQSYQEPVVAAEQHDVAPVPDIEALSKPPGRKKAAWRSFALGALAGALGSLALASWWLLRPVETKQQPTPPQTASVVIATESGDIRGPVVDVAPGAVRLGPGLGPDEEVTAVLRFTPEYPTQQAGIMGISNPDHFVRFGYHFKSRPMMEFGYESEGRYRGPASAYVFDPLAQTGIARWLTLRRSGDTYVAFESSDGMNWRSFGPKLELPSQGKHVLAAIYAFNGRSKNPPAVADFRDFSVGLSFHNRPDSALKTDAFTGWTMQQSCSERVDASLVGGALAIGFPQSAIGCEWLMFRAVPQGEWSFSTLLDFVPVSGSSAGLRLLGTKGNLTVARRDLMNGSIMFERMDDNDVRAEDFGGSPPVWLRLELKDGVISGSFSRDGVNYRHLEGKVPVEQLGALRGIGPYAAVAHWASEYSRPPARFYRVEQNVIDPAPLSEMLGK